ncbi:cell division protein FtsA, partial [Candidatus Berkelbacteria bacterium]|nr:cell division protein FtsA [Candidatus Berkelbacteria bacterium]
MIKKQLSCGIDIGSTKVALTLGHLNEGIVEINGFGLARNQGMRRGAVADIEETVSAISAAIEAAEQMSGEHISRAVIAIGGHQIESFDSKGVIAVSRADGEISEEDVHRVIDAARAVNIPPNRDILHVIPKSFTIDSQEDIRDPVGMTGIRLEVEAHVISIASSAEKNLTKCIYQSGIEIQDILFSPLATQRILLSKRQKELGVILIDLGAGTTNFAVFEEGDVLHSGVVPIGAEHLTNDIAIGLRTSIDTAEVIKVKHGRCIPDEVGEHETLDLSKISESESGTVELKYVSEIIEARLHEIFLLIREDLRKIGRDGRLAAGVILAGGGSRLQGIVELAKDTLKLPVQVGVPIQEIMGLSDKVDDPHFTTSIGLMLIGLETTPKT